MATSLLFWIWVYSVVKARNGHAVERKFLEKIQLQSSYKILTHIFAEEHLPFTTEQFVRRILATARNEEEKDKIMNKQHPDIQDMFILIPFTNQVELVDIDC